MKRMSYYVVVFLGLGSAATIAARASAAFNIRSAMETQFVSLGPGGIKIVGKTTKGTLTERNGALTFVVPLGTLSTGIGLRDSHMKEKYLEVQKYPNAELQIQRAQVKAIGVAGSASESISAVLKLHGKTKPVNVRYSTKRDNGTYHVSANFRVNMRDYGISVPEYMGVTVKPDVDIHVTVDLAE